MITERLLEINGVKIFVRVQGEGDPLIFLHGGPGSNHDYFVPFVQHLAKKRKLVFYDQRGCGRSEQLDSSKYKINDFVEELRGLVEFLNFDAPDFLGHSW